MNFETLRKLARSVKYQNLYARAKELNNVQIFKNNSDFTYLQDVFMYYIELYYSLNKLIADKEEYISEDVLNDWIRIESYILWRDKKNKSVNKSEKPTVSENALIFKRK